ncbi:MAG: hypothetical protein HY741_02585 [Chloroflexi bacterium]|nr:hypothetical protein [Chloroflexota bacterium]
MNQKPFQQAEREFFVRSLLPLIALGAVLFLCVCGIAAFVLLNAAGVITTQVNLFRTATPTFAAQLSTPTPPAAAALTLPPQPTTRTADDTPTPPATQPVATILPTPEIPPTYVAFDADFFAETCPLFEGSNETREYGCDIGEYYMLHKQATTRYAFYDVEYTDAVIEANGYVNKGQGKYEYGVVFRANTEGTAYYVFTVTQDGKYNVALYKDDKYTDLIPYTSVASVQTGTGANRFKLVMRGSRFDVFLNEQYLASVTDANLTRGVVGLFFYNAEPNAEVGFDQFTISTFTPPSPTVTPLAQTVEPTAAPTTTFKPGVYVNSLRLAPRAPKRGEPVTFHATFVNATGRAQTFNWLVEIWEQDPNKKNPYGQADGLAREIPVGATERATGNSWKVAGGGPCLPFRARVVYQDDQARRIPFTRTNGADLWITFQVCP